MQTARDRSRRVAFSDTADGWRSDLQITAAWESLVTLVRAVWGCRVAQEGMEAGGVKRPIADNSLQVLFMVRGAAAHLQWWKWN